MISQVTPPKKGFKNGHMKKAKKNKDLLTWVSRVREPFEWIDLLRPWW